MHVLRSVAASKTAAAERAQVGPERKLLRRKTSHANRRLRHNQFSLIVETNVQALFKSNSLQRLLSTFETPIYA